MPGAKRVREPGEHGERARRAFRALLRSFAAGDDSGLYRETSAPTGKPYAYLWPFTQVIAAGCDLAEISNEFVTDVRRDVEQGLAKYWDASSAPPGYASYVVRPYGKGGHKYYDDNAWVGLDLVRASRIVNDLSLLDAAGRVLAFIVSGWDHSGDDPFPGGVFWTQTPGNRDRNTVSNAPSAELALRLFRITGRQETLRWATRVHDWVNATLRDPADGLYWDHVKIDGSIDESKWSYNQGAMAGVEVLLSKINGAHDPAAASEHLRRAGAIASAALGFYERAGYFGQEPAFNAIFFRNLLAVAEASEDERLSSAIVAAMTRYADTAWQRYCNHDDLYVFRQAAPARLIDQAAVAQILALLESSGARDTSISG